MVRRWGAALILLVASVAAHGIPAGAAVSEEASFVALINGSRSSSGLPGLDEHWDLIDDARRHTIEMISAGEIFHSSTDQLTAATSGWSLIGENVGRGSAVDQLHEAFMNSASHRANVLGDFDFVGVGAERTGEGILFVTVIFMQAAAPGPTATTIAPPPADQTPAPAPPPAVAPAPATTPAGSAPAVLWRPAIRWELGELCLPGFVPICAE